MEILHGHRDNKVLRDSFNALAEQTFGGLNFEGWYQNGFWGESYDPHSIVLDGRVVANVSVNRTDLVIGGKRRSILQLGTVMTAPEFRNRGYIRRIMEYIDREYAGVDGIYLFGNDSVVEFYPKFGFRRGREMEYFRTVEQTGENTLERVPMDGPGGWAKLTSAMAQGEPHSACPMTGNPELFFFYVSQFMQECVYYSRALDAWVIAEPEGEELVIHNVFCGPDTALDEIIRAFGGEVKRVHLGFAPKDTAGWQRQELREEDSTFFVRGEIFVEFEKLGLRIPSLSHA